MFCERNTELFLPETMKLLLIEEEADNGKCEKKEGLCIEMRD